MLERQGFAFGEASVNWRINTGLDSDENFKKKNLIFSPGEMTKEIWFDLPNCPQTDKNGKYLFELLDLDGDAELGGDSTTINVNYDITWPVVEFADSEITARQTDGQITIPVLRNMNNNFIKVTKMEQQFFLCETMLGDFENFRIFLGFQFFYDYLNDFLANLFRIYGYHFTDVLRLFRNPL